jgi:hypothetical protein
LKKKWENCRITLPKKSEKKSWVMNGSLVQFYPIKCATKGTAFAKKKHGK